MKQMIIENSGINASFENESNFDASFENETGFNAKMGIDKIIETSDYEKLYNQPYINERKVIGRKTGADYDLQDKMYEITPQDIDNIFYGG